MSEKDKYEYRLYRVVYSFKIGTIGDSEGRTWAKELISQADFPTQQAAVLHRQHHPDVFKDPWGMWRTKDPYGMCGIYPEERLVATGVEEDFLFGDMEP